MGMVEEIKDDIRNLVYHMYDYEGCLHEERDLVEESNSFERDMDEKVNIKMLPIEAGQVKSLEGLPKGGGLSTIVEDENEYSLGTI
jgi:elongation factor P--beta-lysine ligase